MSRMGYALVSGLMALCLAALPGMQTALEAESGVLPPAPEASGTDLPGEEPTADESSPAAEQPEPELAPAEAEPAGTAVVLHLAEGEALPLLDNPDWATCTDLEIVLHGTVTVPGGSSWLVPAGRRVALRSTQQIDSSLPLSSQRGHTGPLILNQGELIIHDVDLDGTGLPPETPVLENQGAAALCNGGLIHGGSPGVANTGVFTLSGGRITQNTVGLACQAGRVAIGGGAIAGNTAPQGAGLLLTGGVVQMTGGTIAENRAGQLGGGILCAGGRLEMTAGVVYGNHSGGSGGGLAYTGGECLLGGQLTGNTLPYTQPDALGRDLFIGEDAGAITLTGRVLVGPGGLYSTPPLARALAIGADGLDTNAGIVVAGCADAASLQGQGVVAHKPAGTLSAAEAACFTAPGWQLQGTRGGGSAQSQVLWADISAAAARLVGVQPSYTKGPGADLDGKLTLTFSQPMDYRHHGTVKLNGASLSTALASWTSPTSYTIGYTGLAAGTLYKVSVSGFKDANGKTLAANSAYSFVGGDHSPPAVLTLLPGGANAPTRGMITVRFNKAMDRYTLPRVQLFEEADDTELPVGKAAWADGQTLCASYENLKQGTRYRVLLSRCLDRSGNVLSSSHRSFVTVVPMVESIQLEDAENGVLHLAAGESRLLNAQLEGTGGETPQNTGLRWNCSNPAVASLQQLPGGGCRLTGQRAGGALLTASSADGGCTQSFSLVVASRQVSLSLGRQYLMLRGSAEIPLEHQGLLDPEQELTAELLNADTLAPYPWDNDLKTFVGAPVQYSYLDGSIHLAAVEPAPPDAPGAVVLRVSVLAGLTARPVAAECVVALSPALPQPKYQHFYLEASSVTAWARRQEAATLTLRRKYAADAAPLPLVGNQIRFTEEYGELNKLFHFEAVDDSRVVLRVVAGDISRLNSRYTGNIEVVPAGDAPVPVAQKLTIHIKKGPPSLTARAVKLNSFFPGQGAAIEISGAELAFLEENPDKREKNDPLLRNAKTAWLGLRTNAAGSLAELYPLDNKRHSGTLHLLATPRGWSGAPVPVSLKVSTACTPPGVKLSAGKALLYQDAALADGALLSVRATAKNQSLAALGYSGIRVIPQGEVPAGKENSYQNQDLYHVPDYDLHTGAFTLAARNGETPAKGPVLLGLRFGSGANSGEHQLSLKVEPVPKSRVATLKAPVKSITLNPAASENARLPITSNLPGLDLTRLEPMTASLFTTKGKPVPEHLVPPAVAMEGDCLVLSAVAGCTPGQSYRVQVVLPGVNAGKKGGPNATLNLTLRTAREKDKPAAKLTVKGSASLTGPAAATLTAKFSHYRGGFGQPPQFEFTTDDKAKTPVDSGHFTLQPTAPGRWELRPSATNPPPAGKYRLRVAAWQADDGTPMDPSPWAGFRVSAAKGKVGQGAKTVRLYSGQAGARATLALWLPEGWPAIDQVQPRGSTGAFRVDNWPGGCLLRFAGDDPAAWQSAKGRTLTLDCYANGRLCGTARVKVQVVAFK